MDNTELGEETSILPEEPRWTLLFEPRQRHEMEFNTVYHFQFRHGTNGHNERMLIARMVKLVDLLVTEVPEAAEKIEELLSSNRL